MLGVYLEWLGASSEVVGRSLKVPRGVFGGPWRSLGGPREVTRGPWTSLGGSLRVLGGPWGGLPLIVPGGSLWLMRGTEARQRLDKMRFSDAQDASRSLETRPDMSSDAKRSSLARPKGPRSAQGRPGNTLESPKASKVSPKGAQGTLEGAPVRGNARKTDGF